MPEEEASQSPAAPKPFFERHEDFTSLYANNVLFESSVWDLKMVFGELDQSDPTHNKVDQHTAMTISWVQAKIMAYFIQANVALHEADYGKILVPPAVQPPELGPLPDNLKDNKAAQATREYIERLRLKLIE